MRGEISQFESDIIECNLFYTVKFLQHAQI